MLTSNMVGAVVGVQPFGGEGLSIRPKAGGPLYLYRLLANRPESALAVTLARQDAEYPVDAQLKAALTQPLNALRESAVQIVQNCRRYVRNMASWRRQEHNDCCRGRRVNATPGRCCRVSACCVLPMMSRMR